MEPALCLSDLEIPKIRLLGSLNTAPKPVALSPMRQLPSELKEPIWVKTDPSEPTVVLPDLKNVVPSLLTLVESPMRWIVSPLSETAMDPKNCQKDMVYSFFININCRGSIVFEMHPSH